MLGLCTLNAPEISSAADGGRKSNWRDRQRLLTNGPVGQNMIDTTTVFYKRTDNELDT